MKRLITSSLAAAIALGSAQALALSLGPIQVKSGLNQPLVAEIPVVVDSPAEIQELRANLASSEEFQRIGLSRDRVGVPIHFSVALNARRETVIKLTTTEPMREPFVDFLVEVNWAKGRLLREYTMLLDAPGTAPSLGTATNNPLAAPAPPLAATAPATVTAPKDAVPVATPAKPAATPKSAAPRQAASDAGYGPVTRGQTLYSIAAELDAYDGSNINQIMLALLKSNPEAFYRDNINALKAGAVLRIPSKDDIASIGSLPQAAVLVQAQHQSWHDQIRPTLVAQAASTAGQNAEDKPGSTPKSARLALVPPSTGKGNETGAERGGSGSGGAELARTKEALAAREQEATELKSQIKQLEDINSKGQRLISLKDSEIADLQNKLNELRSAKSATPTAAPKPADTPVAAPVAQVKPATPVGAAPVTSAPAPAPLPAPAKPVAPPTQAKPADTRNNGYWFYVLGAILIAGGLFVRFLGRRKPVRKFYDEEIPAKPTTPSDAQDREPRAAPVDAAQPDRAEAAGLAAEPAPEPSTFSAEFEDQSAAPLVSDRNEQADPQHNTLHELEASALAAELQQTAAHEFESQPVPASAPAAHTNQTDAFGLDAQGLDQDLIATRLDLARAYLDMGDAEGARSMLDEVLAEGSEAQKSEAQRLLAELH